MTKPKALTGALLLLPLALVFTGCSVPEIVDAPAAPSDTRTEEPTDEPSADDETDDAAEAPEGAAAEGVAAAGTEFALGDWALVEWDTYDGVQTMEVRVAGIREGAFSDFENVGLEEDFLNQIRDYTPYYMDIEARKVDPDTVDVSYMSIYTDFGAVDANGTDLTDISIFGSFDQCDTASFDDTANTGEVQKSCYIMGALPSQEFGAATFEPFDGIYSTYDGEPLRWVQ